MLVVSQRSRIPLVQRIPIRHDAVTRSLASFGLRSVKPSIEAMNDTPIAVDRERWERAQAWELAFWQRDQKRTGLRRIAYPILRPLLAAVGSKRATGDDWNLWWRDQLDGYRFLPDDLGDFIELGCGPYTNTRLILNGRTARRVVAAILSPTSISVLATAGWPPPLEQADRG